MSDTVTKLQKLKYPHGQRFLVSLIDQHAKVKPDDAWVSIPVDDEDLNKGYKDITWSQFANAINHAVKWLRQSLPAAVFSQPFQAFGYVGPKDLRYPVLTVAAAKLGLVIVLPSSSVTPLARKRILEQKNCGFFLHATTHADDVREVAKIDENIVPLAVPELGTFFTDEPAEKTLYSKVWEEAKDDPWLCFHTSGTTGMRRLIEFLSRTLTICRIPESDHLYPEHVQLIRRCTRFRRREAKHVSFSPQTPYIDPHAHASRMFLSHRRP